MVIQFFKRHSYFLILVASLLGISSGFAPWPWVSQLAEGASELFIRLLRLVSLPIIFLSIVTTLCGMESVETIRSWGRRVLKYTLITTLIAASVALGLFVLLEPVQMTAEALGNGEQVLPATGGYMGYLLSIVPQNPVQPFYENHVLGVLFLAAILGLAVLSLPEENRRPLHGLFNSLFQAVMRITQGVLVFMPIAVWAFVTLFVKDIQAGLPLTGLFLYLACVVLANLIQAAIVLPLFVKSKGLSPWRLFRAMSPALTVAFFSKSSSAALPVAMKCSEERAGVTRKVSRFAFPLCVTINMNACAAFILVTVLFVSGSHGVVFSPMEMAAWVLIATIAAIGNAGVPMGCYFLSSALLAAMNVPLNVLGVILPLYALIDMLESAINVWSDSCVAAVVDQDLRQEEQVKVLAVS